MRILILTSFLLICMIGSAQTEKQISLFGSYQFYDRQSIYFGLEKRVESLWPKVNFETYNSIGVYGLLFITKLDDEGIFGFGSNLYWMNEFFGIGFDARIIFQNNSQRVDLGPSLKLGYKFIWLEYSANFLLGNNPFSDNSDKHIIEFNNIEQNLKLTLSVPIIKK